MIRQLKHGTTSTSAMIAITGLGMVSSLGHQAAIGCSAARAGIVRIESLDSIQFKSDTKGEFESAKGHQAPLISEGFEGPSRLIRLMQTGLEDLKSHVSKEYHQRKDMGFYLSMPSPMRMNTGADLINKEPSQMSADDSEDPIQDGFGFDADSILERSTHLSDFPGNACLKHVADTGHTGFAEALLCAAEELLREETDVAVVGGVDSLVDEPTLEWLYSTQRLKTPAFGVGLMPGEAAAFLLVERLADALDRRANILAVVKDISIGEEEATLLSAQLPNGQGLYRTIVPTDNHHVLATHGPVWFVSDLNGEFYRSHEWGCTLVRLVDHDKTFSDPEVWCPAASVGDTGAASGAVSACMILGAFGRRYAPTQSPILVSTSDGPQRSAVFLRPYN